MPRRKTVPLADHAQVDDEGVRAQVKKIRYLARRPTREIVWPMRGRCVNSSPRLALILPSRTRDSANLFPHEGLRRHTQSFNLREAGSMGLPAGVRGGPWHAGAAPGPRLPRHRSSTGRAQSPKASPGRRLADPRQRRPSSARILLAELLEAVHHAVAYMKGDVPRPAAK